jgi:septal ring factor EnvC (AmiA/AmiB activator)
MSDKTADARRVEWFAPQRPVNGTVFVRPEPGEDPTAREIPADELAEASAALADSNVALAEAADELERLRAELERLIADRDTRLEVVTAELERLRARVKDLDGRLLDACVRHDELRTDQRARDEKATAVVQAWRGHDLRAVGPALDALAAEYEDEGRDR